LLRSLVVLRLVIAKFGDCYVSRYIDAPIFEAFQSFADLRVVLRLEKIPSYISNITVGIASPDSVHLCGCKINPLKGYPEMVLDLFAYSSSQFRDRKDPGDPLETASANTDCNQLALYNPWL